MGERQNILGNITIEDWDPTIFSNLRFSKLLRLRALQFIISCVVVLFCAASWAAPLEYVEVKTLPLKQGFKTKKKEWHASAYQAQIADSDEHELPAKLCIWYDSIKNNQMCFEARASVGGTEYKFQYVDELSIVPISNTKKAESGILFIASFGGGGSGMLRLLSILGYSVVEDRFVNLLPIITITEQGEYQLLKDDKGHAEGVLVVADYIWGEGESHFSPHKYKVSLYKYDENSQFGLIGEYVTETKYNSLDDAENIAVIKHELRNIRNIHKNK